MPKSTIICPRNYRALNFGRGYFALALNTRKSLAGNGFAEGQKHLPLQTLAEDMAARHTAARGKHGHVDDRATNPNIATPSASPNAERDRER